MSDIIDVKPIQPLPENEGINGALSYLYAPTKRIQIGVDKSCEMAIVLIDGKCVMEGNFWDFHPGCYGINEYGDFKGYLSLASAVEIKLVSDGFNVVREIVKYKYGFPVDPLEVLETKTTKRNTLKKKQITKGDQNVRKD